MSWLNGINSRIMIGSWCNRNCSCCPRNPQLVGVSTWFCSWMRYLDSLAILNVTSFIPSWMMRSITGVWVQSFMAIRFTRWTSSPGHIRKAISDYYKCPTITSFMCILSYKKKTVWYPLLEQFDGQCLSIPAACTTLFYRCPTGSHIFTCPSHATYNVDQLRPA